MASCEELRKKLLNLHLGFLDEEAEEELEAHLVACDACRAVSEEIESDFKSFSAWEDEPPPADVIDEVLKEATAAAGARKGPKAPEAGNPAATANPGASAPAKPRRKTEGIDISDLLGDDSLESLEQDLKDLENLVAAKKRPGAGTEVDLSKADVYGSAAKKVPGKLTEDEREKLLKELGLDEDTPPEAGEGNGTPALEDMAKLADTAAKRKSRKMKQADDEWDKIAGTTVFNKEEIEQVLADKKKHEQPEDDPRSTDEWLALSGTGTFAPPAEKSSDADTLLGTTILSAVPKVPTKRLSSRMLAQIKTEDQEKRERRRRVKHAGFLTFPFFLAAGFHIIVATVLGFIVWEQALRDARQSVEVSVKDEIIEDRKELEEEKEKEDTDTPDVTKEDVSEDAEETNEDVPENQREHRKKLIQIADASAPPQYRQQGNVDIVRRSSGGGGGGRWKAVNLGIEWLARHQDDDGKWHWVEYTRHCRACKCPHGVNPTVVKEGRNFSVGLTGLCLLCFLGSGYTHVDVPEDKRKEVSKKFLGLHAKYLPAVKKAVDYLLEVQETDGCFTPSDRLDLHFEGYMYNQGICTLALLEAYQLTQDRCLRDPCRRAVRFIEKAQDPKTGGWDYLSFGRREGRESQRCDVSVASWQVMALKSAIDAGLHVEPEVWSKARRYFKNRTRRRGSMQYASGVRGKGLNFVAEEHYRRDSVGVTSAGLLSKMYLGANLAGQDIQKGASLMIQELPDYNKLASPAPPGAAYNFHTVYYWYYGTLVMFHLGGEYWNTWKEHLVDMLKSRQNVNEARGSWDPKGDFLGLYGGRLYVTAFNILNLEVFYRYLPLYKSRELKTTATAKKKKTIDELFTDIRRKRGKGAGRALRELGTRFAGNEKAIKFFGAVLLDSRYRFGSRQTAFMALKKSGKPALPCLRRAFLQVDDGLKRLIMVAFEQQKDKEAIGLLRIVSQGQDYSPNVRKAARKTLAKLQVE
ncbi:MAG: prenyltransferase/squalene oxidase repeat-containing protein [Planctomycetota bacterium]